MKLPELGVNRPVLTLMIFLGVLLLGFVSLVQLPIDLMPEIEMPSIGVITIYQGASTEDVETRVTKVIEDNVSTVPDLKEVTSVSSEGMSAVTLRFEWRANLDEAANDIRQGLEFAKMDLPDDANEPMLVKFDMSMMPVLVMGITADQSYDQLYKIAEDDIADPLKRIPGVAMAVPIGGYEREIQINVDRQRLEAYHLSIGQVAGILAAENTMLPAGNLKIGQTDYSLRVPGEFSSVSEIGNTIVGMAGGKPIHLKDVANVKDSFEEAERRVSINRGKGMVLMVQKQSGANTVEVIDNIKKALPEIQRNLPPDIKISIAMDSSVFIKRSISNLASTIVWALLFVTLVVIFFLREWRGSIIIALTIPFSLIVAFIFLYAMDYTINMMSLSAIAIAIGMVVDNAIVVYENIYRHRSEQGESKHESALWGASEVGLAITASTVTTVAIFVPIIFVKGITGVMMQQLAIVVIIVLLASLFCALTFTPMISARILRLPHEIRKKSSWVSFLQKIAGSIVESLSTVYLFVLRWSLRHRKVIVFTGLSVFIITLMIAKFFLPTEFMPEMDQGEFSGTVELPVGTRVEVTSKVMSELEAFVDKNVPESEMLFARCGISETGMESMMGQESGTNIIMIGGRLVQKSKRNRSVSDVGRVIADYAVTIPGVKKVDFTAQDPMQTMISGGEKPISVQLYGADLETTNRTAGEIKEIMESIPGIVDVDISREMGNPEYWVEVDREKASTLGLNMAQVAGTLRTSFYGQVATQYREAGDEYDIFVRFRKSDRQSTADVENTVITTPAGQRIPLKSVAKVVERQGPLTLERRSQDRVIYIGGGLYGRPLGDVVKDLKSRLESLELPPGVSIEIGGTADDQAESFKWLLVALLVGIILIYLVMAAQFESLIDPFIIMFSVPFAIVGVIWALFITGTTLSMTSYLGMIMLVGIVVNNAIVLVDYTNILRARGIPVHDAIIMAGKRRLRPVLMTALTTMLALTPMALSKGEGSEMWSPLGISVIGGLFVSTVITLVFVPTLYSIFEERLKGKRVFGKVGGTH
ncbi:MAG: efflux RND transporter permease subunit [Deltaproteobacteria bacterium]|nr:efflux RND transporter permease subunit [Deltaproteobacteria bacterium]